MASGHQEHAPAKINLALHLMSRRADGYHELDSLAVFLEHGDMLEAKVTDGPLTLFTEGYFAPTLGSGDDNLVLRAARLLRGRTGVSLGADITLHKDIPIGAGLGGGSANAAAALRLLNRLWETGLSMTELARLGKELGADVPACVVSTASRMQGIGENLSPLSEFPAAACLLVYPASPLWTSDVYRAVDKAGFSGELPAFPAIDGHIRHWIGWLEHTRNDLQPAALALNEDVADALALLEIQPGNLFTRMSGSGSACFAVFGTDEAARQAAAAIKAARPAYWVAPTRIKGV